MRRRAEFSETRFWRGLRLPNLRRPICLDIDKEHCDFTVGKWRVLLPMR